MHFHVGQEFRWVTLWAGLAIVWFDEIPAQLPRILVEAVIAAAGASLFIYMTHQSFNHGLHLVWKDCPTVIAVAWAMLGGFVVWKLWNHATRVTVQWFRGMGIRSADLRVGATDG